MKSSVWVSDTPGERCLTAATAVIWESRASRDAGEEVLESKITWKLQSARVTGSHQWVYHLRIWACTVSPRFAGDFFSWSFLLEDVFLLGLCPKRTGVSIESTPSLKTPGECQFLGEPHGASHTRWESHTAWVITHMPRKSIRKYQRCCRMWTFAWSQDQYGKVARRHHFTCFLKVLSVEKRSKNLAGTSSTKRLSREARQPTRSNSTRMFVKIFFKFDWILQKLPVKIGIQKFEALDSRVWVAC